MEVMPWVAVVLRIALPPRTVLAVERPLGRGRPLGRWVVVGPGSVGPQAVGGRWPSGRRPAGPRAAARPQAAEAVPGTVPPPPELRAAKDPKSEKRSAGAPAETRK